MFDCPSQRSNWQRVPGQLAADRNHRRNLIGGKLSRTSAAVRSAKNVNDRASQYGSWFVEFNRQQRIDRILLTLTPATNAVPFDSKKLGDLPVLQFLECQKDHSSANQNTFFKHSLVAYRHILNLFSVEKDFNRLAALGSFLCLCGSSENKHQDLNDRRKQRSQSLTGGRCWGKSFAAPTRERIVERERKSPSKPFINSLWISH